MSERTLRILRQDGPDRPQTRRWESRPLPADAVTVADALASMPDVAWDDRCTWPRCGTCTMVIAGRARPACATRIERVVDRKGVITLAPLAGFALRRDLWIDRDRLLEGIASLSPWLDDDEPPDHPTRDAIASFSRCTRCGACLDACPEVREGGTFVGAAAFGLSHPARLSHASDERLDAIVDAGIAECGGANACVDVCPEGLPLDDALREAAAVGTRHAIRRWWVRSKR